MLPFVSFLFLCFAIFDLTFLFPFFDRKISLDRSWSVLTGGSIPLQFVLSSTLPDHLLNICRDISRRTSGRCFAPPSYPFNNENIYAYQVSTKVNKIARRQERNVYMYIDMCVYICKIKFIFVLFIHVYVYFFVNMCFFFLFFSWLFVCCSFH